VAWNHNPPICISRVVGLQAEAPCLTLNVAFIEEENKGQNIERFRANPKGIA
jgi:hypothetical protein